MRTFTIHDLENRNIFRLALSSFQISYRKQLIDAIYGQQIPAKWTIRYYALDTHKKIIPKSLIPKFSLGLCVFMRRFRSIALKSGSLLGLKKQLLEYTILNISQYFMLWMQDGGLARKNFMENIFRDYFIK